MANKEGNHHIEEQIINLKINGNVDDREVQELQSNFVFYYKEYIGTELQRIFDELVPPDVHIQIDNLEIDLGGVNMNSIKQMESELRRKVKSVVEPQIRRKVDELRKYAEQASQATGGGSQKGFSTYNILEHLLTQGHYPSWANRNNGTLDELLDRLLDEKPKALLRGLVRLGKNPKAMERLYQQFSLPRLERIFELLYAKQSTEVKKRLQQLKKRFANATDKILVAAAIEYVLEGSSASTGRANYKAPAFDQAILEAVQRRRGGTPAASKVRPGFEEQYTDAQIIGYFLEHGAIPMWADVESKRSLQELMNELLDRQLVPLQRVLERRAEQPQVLRRLVLQFSDEQVMRLLTVASEEAIDFIKETLTGLRFLTRSRQQIEQTVSSNALREVVLTEALRTFFVEKKSRLVKKSFLKTVLERLTTPTKTDYTPLVKEAHRSARRKQEHPILRATLEQLNEQLRELARQEQTELRQTRREYQQLKRKLQTLQQKRERTTLSASETTQLRQLERQTQQLEATINDLGESDQPLEIEQVVQQRQRLQQRLRTAEAAEREALQKRIERSNKDFQRLQKVLQKEVKGLLADREKLNTRVGSIAEQRIKRVNNRLNKYHRAVQNIVAQLRLDQADLTTFLTNINRALRTDLSTEEKQRLRQERKRLQNQLIGINETIAALEAEEKALQEVLAETIEVVEQGGPTEEVAITGTTKMDLLLFRLQYGATPWWAEELPRQSIEELMLEFANQSPDTLRRAFQRIGKYPVVWERLTNQVSAKAFREVVIKLFPSESQVILGQVELLKTLHFAQAFESLNKVDDKAFRWGVVMEYLLTSSKPFNTQDFVRDIMLQTARTFALSPIKMLELTKNVATNRQEELGAFLEWNDTVLNDPATGILERELAELAEVQQQKDEGTFLSSDQKLELIVEFFSTGRFTERAKALKLTTQTQFEELLLEQIQTNRSKTAQVLGNLIRLSNARTFIINNLSEYFFWEIVNLIRPQAVLTAQRYLKDLKLIQSDQQLRLEKEVLFNYFVTNQTGFAIDVYLRQLVVTLQQRTGRTALAIVTDWKRTLKVRGMSVRSSMLLSVLLLEINTLKEEANKAEDMELKANLNERVNDGAREYASMSAALADIVAQETAENQAATDNRDYSYSELNTLIQQHETELEELEKTLQNDPPATTLERLELERKIKQYKALVAQLHLKRPPILRKLDYDIQTLEKRLQVLRRQAERQPDRAMGLEEEVTTEPVAPSTVERQAEVLDLLETQNPYVLEVLPGLLADSTEEDQRHALFHSDVQRAITALRDERLRQTILDILEQHTPSITPIAELQRMDNLDEQQTALLTNFNQRSPIELWQAWEAVEHYFKEHPEALTPERQRIQRMIEQAIRRREQQNIRSYVTNLRTAQKGLSKHLDQATTAEELQEVQEEITRLWQQQQTQADELREIAYDEQSRQDYERLRRNIDRIFSNIQNRRIRRSNALVEQQEDALQEQLTTQETTLETLEERRKQQVQRLEDAEKTKATPQAPKPRKKRKKLPPTPAPIEEPLQIYNAGMVLLYPFIGRLFNILGYVKDKKFVDVDAQHKAIHILQYLVTGRTEAPEHELLLNKVMCAYPIIEPVPFGIEFTEQELGTAESLLQGVIQNWTKMKSMTPNSLRGSFLVREGTLKEEETQWVVHVPKQTYDILLKSLPWGYSFIRFPWGEKFIVVDWKIM